MISALIRLDHAVHVIFDSGIGQRSAMATGQHKRFHGQIPSTELNRAVGGLARRLKTLQKSNKVV